MNVRDYYDATVQARGYCADPEQERIIERLQRYYDDWVRFKAVQANPLKKLLYRSEVPRGVYLWGGVGRGKSFLMDILYATVPVQRKTRVHFHEFMRGVHDEMQAVKGRADPLDEVARRIAKRYRLICFDEFHVSDVADAMILYRLLRKLFEAGTSFVMTSNYEPATLYPDALYRERILPAIKLIQTRLDVMHVAAGIDYRRRTLTQAPVYHTPLGDAAEVALQEVFNQLANQLHEVPVLHIERRTLRAKALAENVVWFDFETLCNGPRSQNDYLVLASRFQMLILSDVPRMTPKNASAARRFTWLIDVLYDHRVKLIMSAACEPEALYTAGALAHEFPRTVSRIREMQSQAYLDTPWRDAVVL